MSNEEKIELLVAALDEIRRMAESRKTTIRIPRRCAAWEFLPAEIVGYWQEVLMKLRTRKAKWRAKVNGKVWLFVWHPQTEQLYVRRKHRRGVHVVSVADLVDLAEGQGKFKF